MKRIPLLRQTLRERRMARSTEKAYVFWVKRYIYFHDMQHHKDLSAQDITCFLNHLASQQDVAASTQNQALCALVFLYTHVFMYPPGLFEGLERAHRSRWLPVVLSKDEVSRLFEKVHPRF